MRNFIVLICLTIYSTLFSQNNFFRNDSDPLFDGRFGVTIGATNYITDASYLFSKSSTGFTVGVLGTAELSERFELFFEINYNKHFVKFVGRENQLAEPRDIKFNLQNISIPILLNYSYLIKDDYKLGVNIGPSFDLLYNYNLVNESEFDYVLDPLYVEPYDLEFDTRSDGKISFNMFVAFGLNFQYNERFMTSLRYYYGITDPYRNSPVFSPVIDITGRDSYFAWTFTYFI